VVVRGEAQTRHLRARRGISLRHSPALPRCAHPRASCAAVRPPTRILRAVRSEVGVEPQAPPPLSPGQLAITGSQVVLEPAVNNAHAPVWSNCALIFSRVCWISVSVPP
jgi:hypothetical protein